MLTNINTREQWKVGMELGRGAFSVVHVITDKYNNVFAGKISNKKKHEAILCINREIQIQQNLNHGNIAKLITHFETEFHQITVQPYYEAGDLCELTEKRRLKENECKDAFLQILFGLKYLKDNNIIHRDIKPANILLQVNQEKARQSFNDDFSDIFIYDIKIGDFGFATTSSDPFCYKEVGSPNFMAPEIITKFGNEVSEEAKEELFKIDIWSFGATLYTCLTGKPPFHTRSLKSTYRKILANEWGFPSDFTVSDNMLILLENTLVVEPKNRANVEELIDDPFFKN